MTVLENSRPAKVESNPKVSPVKKFRKNKENKEPLLNIQENKKNPCEDIDEGDEIIGTMMGNIENNKPCEVKEDEHEEEKKPINKDEKPIEWIETFFKNRCGMELESVRMSDGMYKFNKDNMLNQLEDFNDYKDFEKIKEKITKIINDTEKGYKEILKEFEKEKAKQKANKEIDDLNNDEHDAIINLENFEHEFESEVKAGKYLLKTMAKEKLLYIVKEIGETEKYTIFMKNIKITNVISSCEQYHLGLLQQIEGLKLKGIGCPKTVSKYKNIYDAMKCNSAVYKYQIDDLYGLVNKNTENKLFYRNGYFDIEKFKFISREEDKEAFTILRIERDFDVNFWNELNEEHENVKWVRENICSVYGNTKEEQDYVLSIFSRIVAGNFDKMWVYCWGSRDSGKGVNERFLTYCFENYFGNFSMPTLKSSGSDPAMNNREILTANMHLKRCVISNETPDDKHQNPVLDGNFIKNASGNDKMMTRKMRDNEKNVKITAKMMLNTNDILKSSRPDVFETMRFIHFPNTYKTENPNGLKGIKVANTDIDLFIQNIKNIMAYTWLILKQWKPFPVDENKAPSSFKLMKNLYFGDQKSNDLFSIFNRRFELGDIEKDFISKDALNKEFKEEEKGFKEEPTNGDCKRYTQFLKNNLTDKQLKEGLKQIDGIRKKTWFGIKLKKIENDDDE